MSRKAQTVDASVKPDEAPDGPVTAATGEIHEPPGRWAVLRRSAKFWPTVVATIVVVALVVVGGVFVARELSKVAVPDLRHTELAVADARLRKLGLLPSTTAIPTWAVPYATVGTQSQAAGARVFPGTKVRLGVVLAQVPVPQPAAGTAFAAAVADFHHAGLDVVVDSVSLPISQGGALPPDVDQAAVTAFITKLGITSTPDFTGAPFAAELDPKKIQTWTVAVRDASQTTATAGSAIHLVATIPISAAPDLRGTSLTDATTAATSDRITLSTDGHDPSWIVTTQTPAPGTIIGWGTPVAVTSLNCGPMQSLLKGFASYGVDPTPRTASEFTSKFGLPALPDGGCDYITSSSGSLLSGTSMRMYFPDAASDPTSALAAWALGTGLSRDSSYSSTPASYVSWSGTVSGCKSFTMFYGIDQDILSPSVVSQYGFAPGGFSVSLACFT